MLVLAMGLVLIVLALGPALVVVFVFEFSDVVLGVFVPVLVMPLLLLLPLLVLPTLRVLSRRGFPIFLEMP